MPSETPDAAKPSTVQPAPAQPAFALTKDVQDNIVVTRHTLTVGNQTLHYTATAGTMVLREEALKDGVSQGHQARARVFFVAYALDSDAPAERPLTFSFNGGPGSSSVWLHLGLLGPRRVVMGDAGALTGPPWGLTDNDFTLLVQSDLVFIDPVSTGYSRAEEGQKPGDFHGFGPDLDTVAEFIRLWTTRATRWLSPKFLIGESYGTTRAAALSSLLAQKHGLFLNGVMLVSSILDFATVDFTPGHDLAYALHLPSYAAVAWYHGRLKGDRPLKDVLVEAEQFADGEYSRALHLGTRLPEQGRRAVAETFSHLCGLSADFILSCDLRVPLWRFCRELLAGEGRVVGRLDGRFTAPVRVGDSADAPEYDPSMSAIQGPYTAAVNHLLHAELNFSSDLPYEVLTSRVWPWSYKEFENAYVRVSDSLRLAMHQNPHLKVYLASGYYDFATPYHAARHTFDHLGLAPELRGNIHESFYEAGHMMYVHLPSLEAQHADLKNFLEWATGKEV